MQFRLTYQGALLGQNSKNRVQHKHKLRSHFHTQLARIWKTHPELQRAANGVLKYKFTEYPPIVWWLAEQHEKYGFAFVPLVTARLRLHCTLNLLLLRPGMPGHLIQSGDLDGRLKVIIDALQMPPNQEAVKDIVPSPGETPFFCLLEDDKLVSGLSVTTDTLLDPTSPDADHNDVRLIITVETTAYLETWDNAGLG